MDYDLIYVGDGRNADHRTRPTSQGSRPAGGSRAVLVPQGSRPAVIAGAPSGYYPPPYQPPFASRFGMSTGEMIDTGIQLIAAVMPLPSAPMAQGEAVTDIENQTIYQQSLAVHAKRDEQLRTLGTLLTRILR